MAGSKNLYEVLRVDVDATPGEIKRAFRLRMKECHPDVSRRKNAERLSRQVNEAFEVLGSPSSREAYDLEMGWNVQPRTGAAGHGGARAHTRARHRAEEPRLRLPGAKDVVEGASTVTAVLFALALVFWVLARIAHIVSALSE